MRKLKYYGPDLRHKIKFVNGVIETILQKRSFLWWWSNICGTNIHIQLRPDPPPHDPAYTRIMPHINPSVMHFQNMGLFGGPLYGDMEFWDESTFELERRLFEIKNAYCKANRETKIYSSLAERQIADL